MSINHPCERRVDGDRVTMMVPARDWVRRPDANNLYVDPKARYAPTLPRYAPRDHLHDRNRVNCVVDPACPGVEQYVRVTRRRLPNAELEEAAIRQAEARFLAHQKREELAADEANELLELRSMGIRATMAAREMVGMRGKAVVPKTSQRAIELEKKLMGTSDTAAERLMNKTFAGSAPAAAPKSPAPAMTMQQAKAMTLRGGWPVK